MKKTVARTIAESCQQIVKKTVARTIAESWVKKTVARVVHVGGSEPPTRSPLAHRPPRTRSVHRQICKHCSRPGPTLTADRPPQTPPLGCWPARNNDQTRTISFARRNRCTRPSSPPPRTTRFSRRTSPRRFFRWEPRMFRDKISGKTSSPTHAHLHDHKASFHSTPRSHRSSTIFLLSLPSLVTTESPQPSFPKHNTSSL